MENAKIEKLKNGKYQSQIWKMDYSVNYYFCKWMDRAE
jgi:hypothetical protein